jgi:hypothetical protein
MGHHCGCLKGLERSQLSHCLAVSLSRQQRRREPRKGPTDVQLQSNILATASALSNRTGVLLEASRLWPQMKQRPIGLGGVEDPTLSRQSAHRWRSGCQPYASAALYSPETLFLCFWYSFLLEAE